MRAIYVNPNDQSITDIDVGIDVDLADYVQNPTWGHWRFPECLPEHDAYVDLHGLTTKKRLWYFGNVHVWGPVVILGLSPTGFARPTTVSTEFVRQHVRWA